MTITDLFSMLRRSWIIVVVAAVLGALGGLVLALTASHSYQAQSQLYVSVQAGDGPSGSYTADLYVRARLNSYVTLVDTPGVIDPVNEELDLNMNRADLADLVDASNLADTVLINVTADHEDPKTAAEIANAAAQALAKEIVRLETTSSGAKPVEAQQISPAQEPEQSDSPATLFNIVLGALLGFMVGLGIVILRGGKDGAAVQSVQDLQQVVKSPVLGAVGRDGTQDTAPIAMFSPSARAEAYRTIRTNMRFVEQERPSRSVVITSAMPEEGKSVTAANLAIALAQGGAKVLLVDADLRKPRLAQILGVDAKTGLTDVLTRQPDNERFARTAIVAWQGLLDFLPSGPVPANPSELLDSQRFADLFERLVGEYDAVVLDAPPLLPVSDAAILTTIADGAILVVRHGQTRRDEVTEAAGALSMVGGRLVGTILTGAPQKGDAARSYLESDQSTASGSSRPSAPAVMTKLPRSGSVSVK